MAFLRRVLPLGLLVALPAAAAAQRTSCELRTPAETAERIETSAGELIMIRGGADFLCTGGTVVKADSANMYQWLGKLQLMGRVFYQDSAKIVTADWIDYFGGQGRLTARGNVVLTERKAGSVMRGPALEYFKARPGGGETRTIMISRPHASLRSSRIRAADAGRAAADSARQPLEVDADRFEIVGERSFRGFGHVEFTRGELKGASMNADFDQEGERLVLADSARLDGEDFALAGDTIHVHLQDDALREVLAHSSATLTGEDLRVESADLRLFFRDGELDRMVATKGRPAAAAGAASPAAAQPMALARDFRLTGDSIDALLPLQKLEQVVAVGGALAVQVDSLAAGADTLVARDWMRGDTITGFFAADTAAADTARTELERLVAVGPQGRASALQRVRDEGTPADGLPSINYMVADRITVHLRDGEAVEVEADGRIRGLHLQPAATAVVPTEPAPRPTGTPPGRSG